VDYRAWSVLGDEIGIKVLHAELGGEGSGRQDDCGLRIRSRYHDVSAKMVNILRATKKQIELALSVSATQSSDTSSGYYC
jgi:hypothetical protein